MERDADQVKEKSNVLQPDFGGFGPRQVIGEAMKNVEHFTGVFLVTLSEDGELSISHNEMSTEVLALLSMKVQGYAMMMANEWGDE